jgi:hypothetical protein
MDWPISEIAAVFGNHPIDQETGKMRKYISCFVWHGKRGSSLKKKRITRKRKMALGI